MPRMIPLQSIQLCWSCNFRKYLSGVLEPHYSVSDRSIMISTDATGRYLLQATLHEGCSFMLLLPANCFMTGTVIDPTWTNEKLHNLYLLVAWWHIFKVVNTHCIMNTWYLCWSSVPKGRHVFPLRNVTAVWHIVWKAFPFGIISGTHKYLSIASLVHSF